MQIREATREDLDTVLSIERQAFGRDLEAELVRELLDDASAQPALSLLAFRDDRAVGHILFTRARLDGHDDVTMSLLAPLAVVPDAQGQGVGGRLIERGLQVLADRGVELVFVLGHPGYYPRHGFQPAGRLGFDAPHPIPAEHADAWMVQATGDRPMVSVSGTVICADAISAAEFWRE
jgi:putative acetyltransferase